ncbi:MAG: hypothetical protein HZC29_03370, partial [Thaumarchaeota archaeon]|nr:hypothetical protein [Nitrososphaerota archaeon]
LGMTATAVAEKSSSVSFTESLSLQTSLTGTKVFTRSLTESLGMTATAATEKASSRSITETLPITATVSASKTASVSLTETLPMTATATTTKSATRSLTATLAMTSTVSTAKSATKSLTDSVSLGSSVTTLINKGPNQELIENAQHQVTVTQSNTELVVMSSGTELENILIESSLTNISMNYTEILSGNSVTLANGPTIRANVDGSASSYDVVVSFADSTTITGPSGWSGTMQLPTFASITIPSTSSTSGGTTTTTSYSQITTVEVGLGSQTMSLNKPVRIEFIGDGGSQGFSAFFQRPTDSSPVFITTQCNADTLASATAQLVGSSECVIDDGADLVIWTTHFTKYGSTKPTTSSSSTSSGSTSTGGSSGGAGGGGGGGGATSGEGGFGGKLVTPLTIYEITYDVCEQNMVRIIAGVSGSEAQAPYVKIRTPLKEVYSATLAQYQPYADANKVLPISRYVYEAPLDPKLNFFIVTAEQTGARESVSATYMVNMADCRNTITVNPMSEIDQTGTYEPTAEQGRPNIFDIKFQINKDKPLVATTANQFVTSKDSFKVSAIIDSPTTLRRAELRVNVAGGNYSNYAAVKMDVNPLQNVTNAYVVSAELPSSFFQAPALVFWVHVINNEEKIQSSERYVVGVKPEYEINARMELDSTPSKAQGTTYRPTSYVYNTGEKVLFGTVSLIVDDKVVYTSPEQLFSKGQSIVNLEWSIPETGAESKHSAYAQINLYDKIIKTAPVILKTFQATKTLSISEPVGMASITDQNEMIARAGLMYSSNDNDALHYRVVAPDGTCVIGKSDSCMVQDSISGNRGNTASVEIDGQIYRIRYSGQDSPLERFSITSVDPIEGVWNVSLESDTGIIPDAQAAENVAIKIKYRSV